MSLLLLFRAAKKYIQEGGKRIFNFLLPLHIYLPTIGSSAEVFKPEVTLIVGLNMVPSSVEFFPVRMTLIPVGDKYTPAEYELDEILTLLMAA